MTETPRTTEQAHPNQEFHDLLRDFAQVVVSGVRATYTESGGYGYPTEILTQYQHMIDNLLTARDLPIVDKERSEL